MVKNPLPNAGDASDMGLGPGSGRSSREGNGNTFQYSCLENPMDRGPGGLQSMGLQRVGRDEHARTASIPAWKIPWTEGLGGYSLWGCKELDMTEHARTSSIPAWKIPRTKVPGGLQSMGLQRVGHDRACKHSQYSCLEKSHGQRGLGGYSPRGCQE